MQFYWKCEECDETNPYPGVKICGTCGAPMTPAAEQEALKEKKVEEKRIERIRKEEERARAEQERIARGKEKQRKLAQVAAEKLAEEQRKQAKAEASAREKQCHQQKFTSIYKQITKFTDVLQFVILIISIGLSYSICKVNGDTFDIGKSQRIVIEHAKEIADFHLESLPADLSSNSDTAQIPHSLMRITELFQNLSTADGPPKNIERQSEYLKRTFHPWDNIQVLYNKVLLYLTGGEQI